MIKITFNHSADNINLLELTEVNASSRSIRYKVTLHQSTRFTRGKFKCTTTKMSWYVTENIAFISQMLVISMAVISRHVP